MHSVLVWSTSYFFFEHPAQMLRILEPKFVGYFRHSHLCGQQLFLSLVHHLAVDVFGCRFSRLPAYHIAEIVWREKHLLGKVSHRRQTVLGRGIAVEIIVQRTFELPYYVLVRYLSRLELPVVKTQEVVEHQS